MKRIFSVTAMFCIAVLVFAPASGAASLAASLTATYDFTGKVDATTVFEGLAFTDNGSLWITSAPFGALTGDPLSDVESVLKSAPVTLLEVDLKTESVLNVYDYSINNAPVNQVEYFEIVPGWEIPIGLNNSFNPVGLASDGSQLFVANNLKVSGGTYTADPSGDPVDAVFSSLLDASDCQEPEGAAYLDGHVYISCQDTNNVVKINDDGSVQEVFKKAGNEFLGLAAIEESDTLIVGDDTTDKLWLYNVSTGQEDHIDLSMIFGDSVPDPDGLAYRNGKIYMSFEHDPVIYEISLNTVVPEPGTLLLLGFGVLSLAALRKKRS